MLGFLFRGRKTGANSQNQIKQPLLERPAASADDLIKELNDHGAKLAASRVFEVFNPAKPVSVSEFLTGRQGELKTCLQRLMTPGNHVLLYGDRGVGKSSIGYVICSIFRDIKAFADYEIYVYRCDSADTIQSVFSAPLRALGHDVNVREVEASETSNSEAKFDPEFEALGVNIKLGHAGEERRSNTKEFRKGSSELAESASWIAEQIADKKALLFIDELDKTANEAIKRNIATIVKHVSDKPGSQFKIMLAGIAQNAAELTAGHPSVQRCLAEIQVGRLEDKYLIEFLAKGEGIVTVETPLGARPLKFSPAMKEDIAKKSFGYPYFTHLIAQAAAIRAIETGIPTIETDEALCLAVDDAVRNAEGVLKKSLDYAVANDDTGLYRRLLIAAAEYRADFLSAADWREAFATRWSEEITQTKMQPFLRRLVSDRESLAEWSAKGIAPVFVREKTGLYRFNDPRMPSFIRLALSGAVNRYSRS